jgi:hypothetical protein
MSAFRPPSGSKGSITAVVTRRAVSPTSEIGRRQSFTGTSSRISNGGRDSPITGVRSVNRIMGEFDRDIAQTPFGRRGLVIGNTQAELEQLENDAKLEINKETRKLENMERQGKTPINDINKQKNRVKKSKLMYEKVKTAINKVIRTDKKRTRTENKRAKSRQVASLNLVGALQRAFKNKGVGGKENVIETQAPHKFTSKPPKNIKKSVARTQTKFLSNNKMGVARSLFPNNEPPTSSEGSDIKPETTTATNQQNTTTATNQQNNKTPTNQQNNKTPTKQTIQQPTQAPSIKKEHGDAKKRGSENLAEERRKRREREGQPRAQRSLEPIFNRQKNTPPGITKTNLERLFQPFKQPVTVTVAPTISVKGGSVQATGGSAKQGIVMLASKATKKKKKTPPPKPQYLKTPGTIRREKEKARSIAVRKQVVASMRTPTKGQRKTHVIQLIDRVLRKMKAPKDTEKKLIKLYESLSEKQIKSLFGGRSPEFVKKTLKKQVEYLKKKR